MSPAQPTIEPMDRSIWPAMSTNVAPTATIRMLDPASTIERTANGVRAGDLACVRHRAQALGLRELEDGRVRLGRVLRLEPAQSDPDHAALRVPRRVPDNGLGLL